MNKVKQTSCLIGNPFSIFVLRGDHYKSVPNTPKNRSLNFNRLHIEDLRNLDRLHTDVRILETY